MTSNSVSPNCSTARPPFESPPLGAHLPRRLAADIGQYPLQPAAKFGRSRGSKSKPKKNYYEPAGADPISTAIAPTRARSCKLETVIRLLALLSRLAMTPWYQRSKEPTTSPSLGRPSDGDVVGTMGLSAARPRRHMERSAHAARATLRSTHAARSALPVTM